MVPPPTVTKSFAPSQVLPGVVSTATIVVHNSSSLVTLNNVAFVDTLPGGLFVAPTPNVVVSCGGGAVAALRIGHHDLAHQRRDPAERRLHGPGRRPLQHARRVPNTIPAGGITTAEGVTNTSPGTATLNVLGPPNVVKAFVPDTIGVGTISRLTISLGNPNAVAATLTAPLVDTLPANVDGGDHSQRGRHLHAGKRRRHPPAAARSPTRAAPPFRRADARSPST